ncbi:hypothetical protein BV25DRAFT_1806250, partial [Artomyces pyxidatus]
AIYPYMAEQEDKFDVVVGDTFVITTRVRHWELVRRDPTGTGVIRSDANKQGWVPTSCLLETRIPVAIAFTESGSQRPSPVTITKTPILPPNVISTNFPDYALMHYENRGDGELDLAEDGTMLVVKSYNHWPYVVKADSGDRGWVPSWYIGDLSSSSDAPPTRSMAAGMSLRRASACTSHQQSLRFHHSPPRLPRTIPRLGPQRRFEPRSSIRPDRHPSP